LVVRIEPSKDGSSERIVILTEVEWINQRKRQHARSERTLWVTAKLICLKPLDRPCGDNAQQDQQPAACG
jgi:hypothetical protein